MIGQRVSHYVIEALLGSGGMAEVYRAVDSRLGRPVALKFLPAEQSHRSRARGQLIQEAKAASALDHPNICTIYEISESVDGTLFVAMAFYDGETLDARLRRGPLPLSEALDVAAQIAEGLAAAHGQGIVHCDIKPANLMLTRDGRVKILDFGISRLTDTAHGGGPRVVGTVPYMSPEQLRKRRLDPRTDVWSLGVVLYQMISGVRPFRGADQRELRRAILGQPAEPVSGFTEDDDRRLNQILDACLAKHRADRYGDARELHADLTTPFDTPLRGPLTRGTGDLDVTGETDTSPSIQGPVREATASSPATGPLGRHRRNVGRPAASAEPGLPSIAVLPLQDQSVEQDQEHLCCGIAEELITQLARIGGLRVATRSSAFDTSLAQADLGEVGRRLQVTTVFGGSVRKSQTRVRITARLSSVADGTILWSAKYDRELRSLFDIQDEIAEKIAGALELTLMGDPGPAGGGPGETHSFEAYNHYLKGRYCWNKRSDEHLRQAVEYFKMAISDAPDFARAHAGLADTYTMLGTYGTVPPTEAMPHARSAAEEALRLADGLAEVYTSRGCVRAAYEWDFEGADDDFLHAVELDPGYATAYQWHAMNSLIPRGRFHSAIGQLEKALEIEPRSLAINASLGLCHYYAGRPEDAVLEYRRTLEIDDSFVLALVFLGHSLRELGRPEEALEALMRAAELTTRRPNVTSALGVVHAQLGDTEGAWGLLEKLLASARGRYVPPTLLAHLYAALGELDLALNALDRALRVRTADLIWLGVDPIWKPLHGCERFRQILGEVGLETPHRTP
ncbi:MAG: protein kinase [Acidobacteriota bacterium]